MSDPATVRITKGGRTATIHYAEGPGRACDFDAELGGGDALLIIFAPAPEMWAERLPWAAGRREEILELVAREVARQVSPGSRYRVHRAGVDILLRDR
jgi:hypothetical protein